MPYFNHRLLHSRKVLLDVITWIASSGDQKIIQGMHATIFMSIIYRKMLYKQ